MGDWMDRILEGGGNILSGIGGLFYDKEDGVNAPLIAALLGGGLGYFGGGNKTPQVGYQGGIPKYTAERTPLRPPQSSPPGSQGKRYFSDVQFTPRGEGMAQGGLASLPTAQGHLDHPSDGMQDQIPAQRGDGDPLRLSGGEFVLPADVVSHLGNGNTDAGAEMLYEMMENVRRARTGNPQQGRQIDPRQMMPR